MQPVAVMPMHDPQGVVFPQLEAITPDLKTTFARAFVAVPPETRQRQGEGVQRLESDDFFHVMHLAVHSSLRQQWLALYATAAAACMPRQVLHLCFADRVAFALRNGWREQFIADVIAVQPDDAPLIFQRSPAAWDTHPRNSRELEQIVTRTGEFLFGQSLDFGWCHLALQAQQLQAILPCVKNHDISMVAEFVLLLRDGIRTKHVDWLAWEDPFILGRAPDELRQEREQSAAETHKRLAYVIPMLQMLDDIARRMASEGKR